MTADNDQGQPNQGDTGIFVVRVGEGEDARYAVCQHISTADGAQILPGSGRSVADLVDSQGLRAAMVSADDAGGLQDKLFASQSGNDLDNNLDNDN